MFWTALLTGLQVECLCMPSRQSQNRSGHSIFISPRIISVLYKIAVHRDLVLIGIRVPNPAPHLQCGHASAKKRMSLVTSVPALARNVLSGKRMAPKSSALCAIYFRTSGLVLSMVPLEVIKATTPPLPMLSQRNNRGSGISGRCNGCH